MLLLVQRWCHVLAHETKERRNGEGLVTVRYDFVVDGMVVKDQLEEVRGCIYWYHEQDADDAAILVSTLWRGAAQGQPRQRDGLYVLPLLCWFCIV